MWKLSLKHENNGGEGQKGRGPVPRRDHAGGALGTHDQGAGL